MRHLPTIAPTIVMFVSASLALGAGIALLIPTEMHTARNSELDRLSQPHVVAYPGQGQAIGGPDSYPVTYSPQWLAVAQQAERARLARWDLPPAAPLGYDQPPPERDLAVEREGAGEVQVQRGLENIDQPAQSEPPADDAQPQG